MQRGEPIRHSPCAEHGEGRGRHDKGYSEALNFPSLVDPRKAEHQAQCLPWGCIRLAWDVLWVLSLTDECLTDPLGQNVQAKQELDSDLVITAT